MKVAVVHDYLTQRGGAERVVLAMLQAFPGAPLHTSLYDPERTFPEFRAADVHVTWLNALPPLRRWHRLALPLLAPAFSLTHVDADVAVCSSSGWAHGARVSGRKLVYCHAPARWLYQPHRYLRRGSPRWVALAALRGPLRRWDRRAAATADCYLAISTATRDAIRSAYGIEAEILHPPYGVDPEGTRELPPGVEPGFVLCVSRLLPYKNVDRVVEAVAGMPTVRLVVVGEGPDGRDLRAAASANTTFLGSVSDAELRGLYAACAGVVSASHEDFGLVPLEAAAFGRPAAVLRFGGFLDTVRAGETGVFFDTPESHAIRQALTELVGSDWDEAVLRRHAAAFSPTVFAECLRQAVQRLASEPVSRQDRSSSRSNRVR